MPETTAAQLVAALKLNVLVGEEWLDRKVVTADIHRPALEMAGFFAHFPAERVQVMGMTETHFFNELDPSTQLERAKKLLSPQTPCLIITRNLQPAAALVRAARAARVPIFGTALPTTRLISRMGHWLDNALAPRKTLHGVLVDLFGTGVLITGPSGIGKSETALELIQKGHRLIADDAVEIRRPSEDILVGTCPPVLANLLELRGVGIIDVTKLFGAGAVRPDKRVELIIRLQPWQEGEPYDRLGFDSEYQEVLGVKVPMLTVPVAPGRNLAMLVETAAANFRARTMGMAVDQELLRRIDEAMSGK
ncbi:MAG: HPr(Ser) kinase/phosphatase [Firmicutes bacterium]|nr:HPr(Ser) kinase/phosphatase [Bacillota bacterium]HOB35323.1 HPr(Ser) kinase/phosphatase [Bacillota bacterium]HPZ91280.1 HPr(Ser) kinase/phosphatase [Bacillota bacterium]HQE02656.1 HPr(Ser) kinase/phosphatase [Bacillota bacterium]